MTVFESASQTGAVEETHGTPLMSLPQFRLSCGLATKCARKRTTFVVERWPLIVKVPVLVSVGVPPIVWFVMKGPPLRLRKI